VCKHILIDAISKPGKRGVKNRAGWKKSNEEAKVLIELMCHLRVRKEES
jgi:hypothetical protein